VDWDNDGKKDLIVGDGLSNVFLFLNNSDSDDPVFNSRILLISKNDLAGAERVTPVSDDWNNDGNKDMITGGMDGQIKIYINKGTDSEPLFDEYTLLQSGDDVFDIGSRSAPRVYDINNDGLKDILIGEVLGYVYLLKNVGTINNPVFTRADKLFLKNGNALKYPGKAPRSRLDITDWNNDGLDDIIVGGADGRVMLFIASQDTSVSLASTLNRAKVRTIESLIKIKNQSKAFLKSMRNSIFGRK
jgi:hypothetical protein